MQQNGSSAAGGAQTGKGGFRAVSLGSQTYCGFHDMFLMMALPIFSMACAPVLL